MKKTIPVFILGTGRCGTLQMAKLLQGIPSIEVHHEYLFENILKTASLFRMGAVRFNEVIDVLKNNHESAIYYSSANYWVDSSNALPWIVEPLRQLFPNAKFIHLLRDGRKVVSSFYHKFSDKMYENSSVKVVKQWLDSGKKTVEPPSEKKYWRPFPVENELYYREFGVFNQFQRLSYYWVDCNMRIHDSLLSVPNEQKLTVKLEDVIVDSDVLAKFLNVFNVPYEEKYMDSLKKPVNVAAPKDFLLTEQERMEFKQIAGTAMNLFGYGDKEEYQVVY